MVDSVRTAVAAVGGDTLPVLIGGEHTLTLGAVRALQERHADLAVLQLDAHTDLRDEYEGRRLSHATVMRRVAEIIPPDRIVALGIRAGTSEEFALAERYRAWSPRLSVTSEVWTWLQDRPVYITIDIDVIDPSDAPGTGNPEPEGIDAGGVLGFVRRLADLSVAGVDLVEVSPPYDPSGRTAVLAAVITRETVLALRGA
jgi:agmatinase